MHALYGHFLYLPFHLHDAVSVEICRRNGGKRIGDECSCPIFFYSALTLVPASLPLAILLAALITFGNFGERFELLAMKAAGISLLKIMRPLIIFISIICCVSFYFQNVIGPKAQTKLWTLLVSMKQKSPEVDIPEGVFYDEIDGYNLYVKHKTVRQVCCTMY